MPPISNPASGRNTATARISRSEKNFAICRNYLSPVIPRQDALKTTPAARNGLRYPSAPPLNATAPRRRAAGGGNAATGEPTNAPKPYSGQRRSTKATVASDAVTTFGKRPGFSPAPGRLLRASITNAAPSVRTSRRGSVLAAASHKSSAAVSSDAAGSNTARYFTPGGTALRRPAR